MKKTCIILFITLIIHITHPQSVAKKLTQKYLVPRDTSWQELERFNQTKPFENIKKDKRFKSLIQQLKTIDSQKKQKAIRECVYLKNKTQIILNHLKNTEKSLHADINSFKSNIQFFGANSFLSGSLSLLTNFTDEKFNGIFFISLILTIYGTIKFLRYKKCLKITQQTFQQFFQIKQFIDHAQQKAITQYT